MKVAATLVARMSSSRLPGKVLTEVGGRPLVGWVLERLRRVEGLDAIVLATSAEQSDDPLATWAKEQGIAAHRGPLEDVLGRVLGAADSATADAVLRANADSPWLDPELASQAIQELREGGWDLVTNVQQRTFPYGVAAEAATVGALERLHRVANPAERSHVTKGFYSRPGDFSILNLRSGEDFGEVSPLTVDTEADLRRLERVLATLGPQAVFASTKQVVAAARKPQPD